MANLNFKHLRYFWAVAHDGNLTRTAQRLNLSQSALSIQIRKLEEQLDQALFERRGRQLHLTEAGRIALDHADRIFSAGDELLDTLAAETAPRHALRVGALSTLSRNFTIKFLRPLIGRPDVDVVLRSGGPSDLLGALENLNLDIVLLNQAAQTDAATSFVSHKLDEQSVSLVGTPKRIADTTDLAQLLGENPLILPSVGTQIRIGFDAICVELDIRPQIAAEVDDMALLRLLAREDAGLAVLPPIVVQDELAQGRLIEAQKLVGLSEGFYAVTLDRRFPNPLVRDLLRATSQLA